MRSGNKWSVRQTVIWCAGGAILCLFSFHWINLLHLWPQNSKYPDHGSFPLTRRSQSQLNPIDVTHQWLVEEKRRILQLEDIFKHAPLVKFVDRNQLDPRRYKLTAGITPESIGKIKPFSAYEEMNLWDLYMPQISCPDMARVGISGDGGKWVCGIHWLEEKKRKKEKCVIYSFGISTESSFETEMSNLSGCELHAFDPSIGRLPHIPDFLDHTFTRGESNMFFHKFGLSNSTGSSKYISLVASLFDIMHSLNHSFIDVLKVDVEHSEWGVFKQLLSPRGEDSTRAAKTGKTASSRGAYFPVGQLLIELHYESVEATDRFFTDMFHAGYVTFSREINLIPTLSGKLPLASEYSFIHPELFFSTPALRPPSLQSAPPPDSEIWEKPIKAVIYFLSQQKRVVYLKTVLQRLYEFFWRDYPHYPILIFHDDFSSADKKYLQADVGPMKLTFIDIKFKIPPNLRHVSIPNRTICDPTRSSMGYRHMCRFHATYIHTLLNKHGYGEYEYVMRLDDDSELTAYVGYDWFRYMKINNKKYGFVNTMQDAADCVTGLWDLAGDFLNRTAARFGINRTQVFFDNVPDGLVVYNNFEISALSVWRHPVWRAFMQAVDDTGGIYLKRWGDAPIHTLGISLFLPLSEVHAFTDVGYKHVFVNQKTAGLPRPQADPFRRLICHFYERWVCLNSNETYGNSTSNITYALGSPSWTGQSPFFYQRIGIATGLSLIRTEVIADNSAGAVGVVEMSGLNRSGSSSIVSLAGSGLIKGCMFTFGHLGREKELATTLTSMYEGFAGRFGYPIVVFYAKHEPHLNISEVKSSMSSRVYLSIRFEPVDLSPYLRLLQPQNILKNISEYGKCIDYTNPEVFGAIHFLRNDAMARLRSLGFDWNFRFSDRCYFKTPLQFDIFGSMIREGKRFGLLSAIRYPSPCLSGSWELMHQICSDVSAKNRLRGASADSFKGEAECQTSYTKWPNNVIIFTAFEVSHSSVWIHPVCQKINAAMVQHPVGKYVYPNYLHHTLCVAATLTKDQTIHFDQGSVDYVEMFFKKEKSISTYTKALLPNMDQMFSPRRFGWLGGDIGSSFSLPQPSDNTDVEVTSKYIWLFGDSLVGTSTPSRRLESSLVSNTVAVATMNKREISSLNFFWSSNKEGAPSAVFVPSSPQITNFTLKPHRRYGVDTSPPTSAPSTSPTASPVVVHSIFKEIDEKWRLKGDVLGHHTNRSADVRSRHLLAEGQADRLNDSELYADKLPIFWPFSGVSVVLKEGNERTVRSLVLGSLVVNELQTMGSPEGDALISTDAALAFSEVASSLFIIENPHDPPCSWQYSSIILPTPSHGVYKWYNLVETQGRSFAASGDFLFVFGTYSSKTSESESSFDFFGFSSDNSYYFVSRVPASDAARGEFINMEVFCVDRSGKGNASWVGVMKCREPHKLFGDVASEPSLHWNRAKLQWEVFTLKPALLSVRKCHAAAITGPWHCAQVVGLEDSKWNTPAYILYAAKAHPELLVSDGNSAVVLSYVPNTVKGPSVLMTEDNFDAYSIKFFELRSQV